MSGEQWAVLGIGGAILVYPTWCLITFWAAVLRLFPEQPDVLDEDTETYGPAVAYGPVDDTMAVAKAVGVAAEPMDAGLLIDWHNRQVALADASLEQTLNSWSLAAAGHPYVDHTACAGDDCTRVICCCPMSVVGLTCPGTVEQACSHHTMLCDECRRQCTDCRIDYLDDAGVQ